MDFVAPSVFFVSTLGVAYTFVGYAVHVCLRAKLFKRPVQANNELPLPEVTVVLVAHNEARRIAGRVCNLLASDYPPEKLRILIVSDGSTDDTLERVPTDPRVSVHCQPERMGKPSGLNAGVAVATTPVIVFADARQVFEKGAITALVRNFSDPDVGAVSGSLEIAPSASSAGAGVDVYWKLEKAIRRAESQTDSAIGCTGAIYAIRRELYKPIPKDTILDDVVIPMQIALSGHRVLFEPSAIAWDPQSLEPEAEKRRKKRTLAGNFQMLFRYPGWLLPRKNRLWWELIAHKYLRLAAPAMLMAALVSSGLLMANAFFRFAFLLQCTFYLLAAMAKYLPRTKLTSLPAGFVFLNTMTLRAFWHYISSRDLQRWETSPRR